MSHKRLELRTPASEDYGSQRSGLQACLIAGEEVLQTVHGIMGDSESRQIREEGHLPAGLLQDLLTEVCKEPQDAPRAHHFSRVC
ncbi:hypothetical protein SRHO_G00111140 [Serrasalmus rhombeus]